MAEKKTKRRLKNIRVDEISLVDKGAVQDADFVVLSKRIDTVPEATTETKSDSEVLQITKAMSEDESFDAANLLHMMAEFTGLVKAMHRSKSRLSPELQTSFDSLKSAMFDGEKVEKKDDLAGELAKLEKMFAGLQDSFRNFAPPGTVFNSGEPIKKTETETRTPEYASSGTGGQAVVAKSTLEEAAELLEKRRQDKDESEAQQVLAALQGVRGDFEKFEADSNGRHEKLDDKLNLAMGKG